jgi:hypothetical protein
MTKPQFTLHKLPEGFIVTSDQKDTIGYLPVVLTRFNEFEETADGDDVYDHMQKGSKIVIALPDQIDFSSLSPEIQKEIGWFDVTGYADNHTSKLLLTTEGRTQRWWGIHEGFRKAQELLSDRKFTKDELINMFILGGKHKMQNPEKFMDKCDEIIESLSHKSWKVELEMERTRYPKGDDGWEDVYTPKFTDGKIKLLKLL